MNQNLASQLFPILSLPETAMKSIFKAMDVHDIITLCLASKTMRSLVKHDEPIPIDVYVQTSMKLIADDRIPICELRAIKPEELAKWQSQKQPAKITINDYLGAALFLFGQKAIRRLLFQNNLNEDFLESVFRSIPSCENVTIYSQVSDSSQRRIFARYGKTTRQLDFYGIPPVELRHRIMIQNLNSLNIQNEWIKLDHLLSMNCSSLGVANLDPQILNRFLKLWIHNKICPRLEYMQTDLFELNLKQVLTGIQYQEISMETVRTFKHSKRAIESDHWLRLVDTMEVRGGFDFMRRDGTPATIAIRPRYNRWRMEFFVW